MKTWILWIAIYSTSGGTTLDRIELASEAECQAAAAVIRPEATRVAYYSTIGLACIQQTLPEPPRVPEGR